MAISQRFPVFLVALICLSGCAFYQPYSGRSKSGVSSISILVDRSERKSFGDVQGGAFVTGLSIYGGLLGGLAQADLKNDALVFERLVQRTVDTDESDFQKAFLFRLSTQLQSKGYRVLHIDKPARISSLRIEDRSYGGVTLKGDAMLDFEFRTGYLFLRGGVVPQTELVTRLVDSKSVGTLYQVRLFCCARTEVRGPYAISLAGPERKFATPEELVANPQKARDYLNEYTTIILSKVVSDLSLR